MNEPPEAIEPNSSKLSRLKDAFSRRKFYILAGGLVVLGVAAGTFWYFHSQSAPQLSSASNSTTQTKTQNVSSATTGSNLQGLQLDPTKNYGNKYADGILPVGDGKYTSAAPQKGYVYACNNYVSNLQSSAGGAMVRGPWFMDNNTEYDANKKLHVEGNVMWQAEFSNRISGDTRTIVTNDLPDHPTGIFPISSSDPAYTFDRNPNSIEGQTFTYNLSADPTYNSTPTCEGGSVGVMLTGVALFNGLDAGGRDAGAWEIQDGCDGHPQSDGIYHYHTLSSCIKNISVQTVIGFALDGFPITGPEISKNNVLTTADLDECHGITSQIVLDGKTTTMYHYVMTQDFPYSVNCFRGTPITPPGQGQQKQSQQQKNQRQANHAPPTQP